MTNIFSMDIPLLRNDHEFAYYYNFRLFSTNELRVFGNTIFTQTFIQNAVQILSIRNLINRQLTSEPILLLTIRNEYIIVTLNGNYINIVMESSTDARNQDIERILSLKVPDINNIIPGRVYDLLPRLNLPPSDLLEEYLGDLRNDRGVSTFSEINIQEPISLLPNSELEEIYSPLENEQPLEHEAETQRSIITDNLFKESYETLLKRLYGIPIQLPDFLIINGIRVNFASYQQIIQMLSHNQIEHFVLDPLLQPWAGPPDSLNRILILFGRNGLTHLVKARYDLQTNQIFPPV
jgi:hypothetical protein